MSLKAVMLINDSGDGDHDDGADDNENVKLGGRWSTAKERKDLKREKWSQSGRS